MCNSCTALKRGALAEVGGLLDGAEHLQSGRSGSVFRVVKRVLGRKDDEEEEEEDPELLLVDGAGNGSDETVGLQKCEETGTRLGCWDGRACWRSSSVEMAIKVIDCTNDPDAKRQAVQELKFARAQLRLEVLQNKFLMQYEFVVRDGLSKFYFGMELCPYGDLFTVMQQHGPFCISDVRLYSAEIASALQALHSLDIVHGDVKSENIGVTICGNLKLFDFGMSVQLDEIEKARHLNPITGRPEIITTSGSLHYVAPEVLHRKPHGLETDFWSLGICVFEMAFGFLPFDSDKSSDLCHQICSESIMFHNPSEIPKTDAELEDMIAGLLTKTPEQRLGFMDGAAELLRHPFFVNSDEADPEWSLKNFSNGLCSPAWVISEHPRSKEPESNAQGKENCQEQNLFASDLSDR